ncbi:hypothetical protein [Clostridium algidicarnis]|uniref:hypothetical protein n=1 Tax=Clostridium algidicarnis TaxID=37659 RepID=UPI001C0E039D|nr:hypothetical protein [Clostridium algidicarnis]MBU3228903.1 hypothetical protein [Clostridium algidicarnis]MBU3252447.1 hypothetical protein [Clostridium algidicarnis]
MSWDTMYDRLEQSQCACGNGVVTRRSYSKMDDWNRTKDGYYDEKIQCEDCNSKFHIEHYIKHFFCPPWKGDGISDTPYLVPNSKTLKHDVSQKQFNFRLEEEIVSSFNKNTLETIVDDMTTSKYSTRLKLTDSEKVVDLYFRQHKKRSLPNIIKLLQQCVYNYNSYEWGFTTMQKYRHKEQLRIETNSKKINDSISQSFELEFKVE